MPGFDQGACDRGIAVECYPSGRVRARPGYVPVVPGQAESPSGLPRVFSPGAGSPRARRALSVAAGLLTVVLWGQFLASLPEVSSVRRNDFPAYWAAGLMLLEGQPERIYSTEWKWFTNLPIVAVLCVPLGALDYESAWKLLWWLSVASFGLCFALLLWAVAQHFPPLTMVHVAIVALIFFAFAPVMRRCLTLGQTTPLLVLLFGAVYLLCRAGYPKLSGALLGLLCVIKIPPLLLIPMAVLRKRFALAGTAAAVVVAAVLASWVLFGGELMQQYADRVIWDNFGRAHAAFNNQSLDGAFMRVLTDRGLANWVPVDRPIAERLAVFGILAAVVGLLFACGRSLLWPSQAPRDADPRTGSLELEIGLGVGLMLLAFPISWIHYYLFLVVPLCVLPFWWIARGLAWHWPVVVLFVLGTWLAGGSEVRENEWYAAREADRLFRLQQNLQPLGVLLLIAALAQPLREIAWRQELSSK
jgi:hypothetical protein